MARRWDPALRLEAQVAALVLGQRAAARAYGIPPSTLCSWLRGYGEVVEAVFRTRLFQEAARRLERAPAGAVFDLVVAAWQHSCCQGGDGDGPRGRRQARRCPSCGWPVPPGRRRDALYCTPRCGARERQRRRRQRLRAPVTPSFDGPQYGDGQPLWDVTPSVSGGD